MSLSHRLLRRWALRSVTELGSGVQVLGTPRIENYGYMQIGNNVVLNSRPIALELCTSPNGHLFIGPNCNLGFGVSIGVLESVRLGAGVRLGPYVMIVDSDFHDLYNRSARPPPKPVSIGDGTWIGAKASILRGVTIGRNAVIGVGAVVNRDVEDNGVVAGVPARPVEAQHV